MGWAVENEGGNDMREDDFKNTRGQSKCNASFGGAFEFKVNGILCCLGLAKHST